MSEKIHALPPRFIPNASYFQAHPDPARPCYTHICYPKDDSPFYFWEERFLADKCCKYRGNEIVYGTEVLLESDDQCSEEIVRCEVPQNDPDAPLIPVHEVSIFSYFKTCHVWYSSVSLSSPFLRLANPLVANTMP